MNRPLIVNPAPHVPPADTLVSVDRAIAEIRRGGMVALIDDGAVAALLLAAEAVTAECLTRLTRLGEDGPWLAVSARRADVLGLGRLGGDPRVALIASEPPLTAAFIQTLANPLTSPMNSLASLHAAQTSSPAWAAAAVSLVKLARLLPAAVVVPCRKAPPGCLSVTSQAVLSYQRNSALALRRVAEARVPLADAEDCRVVAFRPADGGVEHLALIIGDPDRDQPVLTRLHSECFTGDLLGSLRCDCGDQLKGAIQLLAQQGGGVLLYLAQEGRGIGLVNKLRAYNLQDDGFDTLDANLQLGFDDDERFYLPAVEMLKLLGISRVRLLTNNPAKVEGLSRQGIIVAERVPHVIPSNDHNRRYLATKAQRSGHLF